MLAAWSLAGDALAFLGRCQIPGIHVQGDRRVAARILDTCSYSFPFVLPFVEEENDALVYEEAYSYSYSLDFH